MHVHIHVFVHGLKSLYHLPNFKKIRNCLYTKMCLVFSTKLRRLHIVNLFIMLYFIESYYFCFILNYSIDKLYVPFYFILYPIFFQTFKKVLFLL